MKLNEATKILNKAGFLVEDTNLKTFEQEAENIVYSYGVDKYGLDVDQIVKIMEDASKIKDVGERTMFVHKQFTKITGLSMFDIEEDEKLEAALYDMCKAVYEK